MFALNYNFVNVVINNKLPPNETNDVNKPRRLILGLFILILVDILWIASSQLTKYIYAHEQFEKPFFSTYVKTSMFSLYLLGLCCWPPARDAAPQNTPENYTLVDESTEDENFFVEANNSLSDSTFVPVRASGDTPDLSSTEGDDHLSNRAVRFNRVAEVRHMSAAMATEALVARLSWAASERAGRAARSRAARRRAARLAKLALGFCILWFCAEYTYAASLVWVEAGVVALLWSGWAVFALALAALFPVGAHDRCSPSKLLAAGLSLVGLVAVSLSVERRAGAFLALLSGFCYAAYLLLLRRHLLHDDRLHIPLLFGLIGVFSSVLVWPVGGALHATAVETFEWPSRRQWALLLLNGLLATLLAELMWLWGCVISASWQAGAACLCAAAPLALAADAVLRVPPTAALAVGAAPLAIAGAAAILLAHRAPAADPVRAAVGALCGAVRRGRGGSSLHRLTELDDQTEALISINCARDEQIA